jgi:hypothetical protein
MAQSVEHIVHIDWGAEPKRRQWRMKRGGSVVSNGEIPPLQGVCTTIERTDESRRAHFSEANENKRGQMEAEVRGASLYVCGGRNVQQPVLFLSRHKLIFERRSPMLQNNVEMDLKMCLIESGQHRGGGLQKSPVYLFPV